MKRELSAKQAAYLASERRWHLSGAAKHRPRRRTSRDYDACAACGEPLPTARAADVCEPCDVVRQKARQRQAAKPIPPVRYIAGYVPPKGSIAMALLHQVHPPIRGLGL
jgi:hypothetical protein